MAVLHANPGEIVDLRPLGPKLRDAKTTAIVKTPSFEAARLIIRAGAHIAPHQVAGPITLYCIEGRARLELPDSSFELAAGEWAYIEGGVRHAVHGIEDSSLLLTIVFDS
ncbi:MAG: cupin domain-containing protein [Bradyrhizobium sp.]|jgi:quercetin dioxygenase-like cupin family protein|uniref:cupin domain-containing protein n=1 Tax=Bradyrhizobium sp. TaxID=376 RepID=UPI003C799D9A